MSFTCICRHYLSYGETAYHAAAISIGIQLLTTCREQLKGPNRRYSICRLVLLLDYKWRLQAFNTNIFKSQETIVSKCIYTHNVEIKRINNWRSSCQLGKASLISNLIHFEFLFENCHNDKKELMTVEYRKQIMSDDTELVVSGSGQWPVMRMTWMMAMIKLTR